LAWVAGVRFKPAGKIYYFECENIDLQAGDAVIVETIRGIECGSVAIGRREMSEEELVLPLKSVVRKATEADIEIFQKNRQREAEAMEICKQKVKEHKLPMRLIDVEYTFDMGKVIFYFTAEGRVDFRELVKDLAAIFKTRIELRQIGVRDEAKMLGGLGTCGRVLCCNCFLGEFEPVSIRMAKEQNLSLNPTKISGICGRLMCCLKYESELYESGKGSGEDKHGRKSAGVEIDLKGIDAGSRGDQGAGKPTGDGTDAEGASDTSPGL
jgi:cell fate regulator YaaT (PSP1 superfamily)